MNTNCLEMRNISKNFQHFKQNISILQNLELSAKLGETLSIIGPSGAGKSTLLNIIGLLDSASSGVISWQEKEIQNLTEKECNVFRSKNIGFVFQDHHLLPQLTVLENILLPTLIDKNKSKKSAEDLLRLVGLEDRKDFFPWQISGGECQRVAIARGIMNASQLLLCDEPTGNLDNENGEKIINLLKSIATDRNILIIMVTHNLKYAHQFDRCLLLRDGSLHTEGENGE